MSLLKQGVQNCRAVRAALHRAVCGLETTSWAAAGSRSSAMALELEPGFQTWPVMAAVSRGRSSLTKLDLNLSPWPILVFLSPLDERTKATLFASLELWKAIVLTAPQANWVYSFCLLHKQQKPKALPKQPCFMGYKTRSSGSAPLSGCQLLQWRSFRECSLNREIM